MPLLPVIRRLYESATDADRWPAFLEELARSFVAQGAHILRVQPHEQALSFSVLYGYDDFVRRHYASDGADLRTALTRYEQDFQRLMPTDPRMRLGEQYPSRPFSCRLAISDAELHGSRIYREHLTYADVEYSLCVSLPEDDGSLIMMGVFRGKQGTRFDEEDVEQFGELIPHLKQAVTLSEHLARLSAATRMAFEALDGVAIGILLVDEHARLVHANAAAKRIIDLADGLSVSNGTLRLNSTDEDARLRRDVWDAIAKARAGEAGGGEALAVKRPSGNEPFPLLVAALWGNHLRHGLARPDRPLAILFVTNPEEPHEAPAELLRRLFGLTPAEARICERMVLGRAVEETASELCVAAETVRVHLKRVFAKTGVSRQAELVAKILATPVWLRDRHRQRELIAR
jgi:DNA-binding CsgD family transcriptional regulator